MQEVVFIEYFRRSFRVLIISFHGVVSTITHFSLYAYGTFFSCFRIDNFYFRKFEITSYSITTDIKRVVNTGGCHARSGFGEPIYAGHFHVHFLFYLFHQFDGTKRTCHNSCAETGHIEHVEHRMMQFGYEHGRNSVECGTAFFVNGCQYYKRIETFYHHLGTTMGQAVHGG